MAASLHNGKKIFDAVFLGAACQFPAVHRIETECLRGALSKRIGSLSEDAIGYALERQDPGAIFTLGCDLARQLKRNGIFRSKWSRGLVVAAVVGIEICSSFARSCDYCMERKVEHKVDGELREEMQYYHRICAVTVVSSAFPIPLGIRFQKDGETEVSCSLSLLQDLLGRVGRRFLDLLVADALYLQAPFVRDVEGLGLDWVINLKENDTEVFQTITTDGHLKKPSVHQGRGQALLVLTMIRVLAFTLTMVFFHRQVRSHLRSCCIGFCDLAQRLAYQFVVTAQPDSS